jgi:hypothetical protein
VCQLLTIFVLADFPQALLLAWIVLRDYTAHLQVRKLGNSLAGLSSKGVGIHMYASLRWHNVPFRGNSHNYSTALQNLISGLIGHDSSGLFSIIQVTSCHNSSGRE